MQSVGLSLWSRAHRWHLAGMPPPQLHASRHLGSLCHPPLPHCRELGVFVLERDAARAYDLACLAQRGAAASRPWRTAHAMPCSPIPPAARWRDAAARLPWTPPPPSAFGSIPPQAPAPKPTSRSQATTPRSPLWHCARWDRRCSGHEVPSPPPAASWLLLRSLRRSGGRRSSSARSSSRREARRWCTPLLGMPTPWSPRGLGARAPFWAAARALWSRGRLVLRRCRRRPLGWDQASPCSDRGSSSSLVQAPPQQRRTRVLRRVRHPLPRPPPSLAQPQMPWLPAR